MKTFKDLNKALPDGRVPLQEITTEILRQYDLRFDFRPDKPKATARVFRTRYVSARPTMRQPRMWQAETYAHAVKDHTFEFDHVVSVTPEWRIVLERDFGDVIFVPLTVPVFKLLLGMGFDLGL